MVVEPEVVSVVGEPEAFVLASVAVEPGVGFVAVVSVADVAGPQACVDIPVPFDVLGPVSLVLVAVDSSGHPQVPCLSQWRSLCQLFQFCCSRLLGILS